MDYQCLHETHPSYDVLAENTVAADLTAALVTLNDARRDLN